MNNRPNLQGLPGGRMPQQQQQQGAPSAEAIAQARMQNNPMPNDNAMVPTLRGFVQCPIGQEQKHVSMLVGKMIESHDDKYMPMIGEAVTEGLRAEFCCRKNLEERTVAKLEEDSALSSMLDKLRAARAHIENREWLVVSHHQELRAVP
jgi:hypothetical protein